MYNSNQVGDQKIQSNYEKIFKYVGAFVGLNKFNYKDYLNLSNGDTRKENFERFIEENLPRSKDDKFNEYIATINSNVRREDRIEDKESFFALGEKMYSKKEEKTSPEKPLENTASVASSKEGEKEIKNAKKKAGLKTGFNNIKYWVTKVIRGVIFGLAGTSLGLLVAGLLIGGYLGFPASTIAKIWTVFLPLPALTMAYYVALKPIFKLLKKKFKNRNKNSKEKTKTKKKHNSKGKNKKDNKFKSKIQELANRFKKQVQNYEVRDEEIEEFTLPSFDGESLPKDIEDPSLDDSSAIEETVAQDDLGSLEEPSKEILEDSEEPVEKPWDEAESMDFAKPVDTIPLLPEAQPIEVDEEKVLEPDFIADPPRNNPEEKTDNNSSQEPIEVSFEEDKSDNQETLDSSEIENDRNETSNSSNTEEPIEISFEDDKSNEQKNVNSTNVEESENQTEKDLRQMDALSMNFSKSRMDRISELEEAISKMKVSEEDIKKYETIIEQTSKYMKDVRATNFGMKEEDLRKKTDYREAAFENEQALSELKRIREKMQFVKDSERILHNLKTTPEIQRRPMTEERKIQTPEGEKTIYIVNSSNGVRETVEYDENLGRRR